MRLSNQLFQQKLRYPLDFASLTTNKLIEQIGFVEFIDSGFPFFTPIGKKIIYKLEQQLTRECERNGFDMVQMPSVHNKAMVISSGKYETYKSEFLNIEEQFVLKSTSEEYFLELAKRGLISYAQLPIRLFGIERAIRLIKRPQGILKLREFSGAILLSFDENEDSYNASSKKFQSITEGLLGKITIPFKKDEKEGHIEYYYNSKDCSKLSNLSLAMGYRCLPSGLKKVKFATPTNTLSEVLFSTYGIGLERMFYAACDSCRNERGFNFPKPIRPFDNAVIVIDSKDQKQISCGEQRYATLKEKGVEVYLDDRKNLTLKNKLDFADCLGVQTKLIIGPEEARSNNSP